MPSSACCTGVLGRKAWPRKGECLMPLTVAVLRNCSKLGEKKKRKRQSQRREKGKRKALTEFSPFPKVLCENELSQMCPKEGTHLLKSLSLWLVWRTLSQIGCCLWSCQAGCARCLWLFRLLGPFRSDTLSSHPEEVGTSQHTSYNHDASRGALSLWVQGIVFHPGYNFTGCKRKARCLLCISLLFLSRNIYQEVYSHGE